jgi:methionyl aminopeptidase
VAADVLAKHGAGSPFLNYHPRWAPVPFPAVLCVSVNDAVVHGIPTDELLVDGDLVSVDFGATLHGWCGDAARSFVVGTPRTVDVALIEATDAVLAAGIAAAKPGNTLGDVGHAIATTARTAGYGMLADHGGHGIGRTMHEDPHVPNVGRPGKGMKLRPGLVIAIEPMLIADGTDDYTHDSDGWTLRTATGARAAHSEHTVAVTTDGARILTN